jgi:hypothetical protein
MTVPVVQLWNPDIGGCHIADGTTHSPLRNSYVAHRLHIAEMSRRKETKRPSGTYSYATMHARSDMDSDFVGDLSHVSFSS